jgi:hypothetical protein
MSQALLADLLVVAHFAFIAFVVAGGVLVRWWPTVAYAHLPAFAWAAYVTFTGAICPLTPLEVALRRSAGQGGHESGFVEHYIVPLIYPPGLTRPLQVAIGAAIVTINVAVYAWAWQARRKPKGARGT